MIISFEDIFFKNNVQVVINYRSRMSGIWLNYLYKRYMTHGWINYSVTLSFLTKV